MSETNWNVCLTHDPASGGLYRSIGDFAVALDARTLSFDDGRMDRRSLVDGAVRIPTGDGILSRDCHWLPRSAADAAAAAIEGADLLVVHSLFRAHANWAAQQARQRHKPCWAVPHACLDPRGLRRRGIAKRLWMATTGSRFLAGAAHVIFSTRLGMEKARRWLRTANGRVVPWPVDMPSADAAEASRSAFRERLGIPEEAPILLFVGRFHTVKRPLETVRAFCASAPPSAHLVMMGVDGDVLGRTVFESVPMPWRERVHVVNGRSSTELAAAYRAADGFVSLSFQENFGYAAADALAHGLPVILSPGHDLAYEMPGATAGRFECGWLLPDDSDAAARQAIAEWAALAAGGLNTESRLKAMGRRGQEWAADHLGRDRFRTSLQRLV